MKLTKERRTQGGETTSDVVMSSWLGNNTEIFNQILQLHVPENSTIADVTFAKGVFWRKVDLTKYKLLPSDIRQEPNPYNLEVRLADCRNLPYEDKSLDAIVFDPPYMEGFYRKAQEELAGGGSHSAFRKYYSNGQESEHKELKWHDRVVDMYLTSAIEAQRVLLKAAPTL